MKLTILLVIIGLLEVRATGVAQTVTLSGNNIPLKEVFAAVKKQTGYVAFGKKELFNTAKPVTLSVRDMPLPAFLAKVMEGQPLTYFLDSRSIILSRKSPDFLVQHTWEDIRVNGRIVSPAGVPLEGASVRIKGRGAGVSSGADGRFSLTAGKADVLVITYVGYKPREVAVQPELGDIVIDGAPAELEEVVINKGYYSESNLLSTGSVSKVTSKEISTQPVANPVAALQGRVPGLLVTASSGVPGATFKVQIRGQNSILQGSDPLYIVDGVPIASNDQGISNLSNATGTWNGISLLSSINPADIASIEVLKDADATAIYGSRGANGVILITTHKGDNRQTSYRASVYHGWNRATRGPKMLNTQQYIEMRREAFRNDGVEPTPLNAPDLFTWDTTQYTDFVKLMSDNTAHTSDAQLSATGGNDRTRFLIGAGYHRETSLSPGDQSDRRASLHFNISHTSANDRLRLQLSGNYANRSNNLTTRDLAGLINMPPHMKLVDDDGSLVWGVGGISYRSLGLTNPLAESKSVYEGRFQNLVSNLQLSYRVLEGLELKLSGGYTASFSRDHSRHPTAAIDPSTADQPYAYFANNDKTGWILEPQASYNLFTRQGQLSVLVGGSFQQNLSEGTQMVGRNYTNDALLGSIAAAGSITSSNTYELYKYGAFFGRINYNHRDKYVLNLTGRRDGSSRFGPGRQFEEFGAVGAAWIFSQEPFVSRSLPFLSFGKLRSSYGITGNDQIGNYAFLDTWTATSPTFQGIPALQPSRLFNPDFNWESNKKLEAALELGFLKGQLMFSAAWYLHRSGNQLINYPLPIQTGFTSMLLNSAALVENQGLEFALSAKAKWSNGLRWTGSINLSIPRNRLKDFPNLEISSYANVYVIGQPLSVKRTYEYLGLDQATGIYTFHDVDHDGLFNIRDRIILKNIDPKFYGGFLNTLSYRQFTLNFLFEFRKREGVNFLNSFSTPPGYLPYNFPVQVLSRWQQPGDDADLQRYVAVSSSPAFTPGYSYIRSSDAVYRDASYVRLKNVALAYRLPEIKRLGIKGLELNVQAQNLFVISGYKDTDPEIQNVFALPLVRTITTGLSINF
ncbi:SusC/RagA family TonB-linked outer membrane protein [Chitinophaga cymbidii]|uniref:SusC/RagA family TonB-linked outer membrane protein n=1 Tax=Chitinophaga cymbidii TaxID=1096750 RepID=A0A512RQW5_9BACT|nr:SusC/RagA family TonB-linked outer membrane protein [Chitinophaga cymbidii]GEP98085.1 SusC/RagA family TonB-linked outer membrane protein [Chitinophaga cymbidii]